MSSSIACGSITNITIPDDIRAYTIENLVNVTPIRPLLFRPDYVATEQSVLAKTPIRFVSEPIVAVLGSSAEEAEDNAERVIVAIDTTPAVTDVGAVRVHKQAADNTLVDAKMRTDGLDDTFARAAETFEISIESGGQSAMPLEARGGAASFDRRTGRATCSISAPDPHWRQRCAGNRRSAYPRRRARCRRRLRPESAAIAGICCRGVAGSTPTYRCGVDRRSPREPDGVVSQSRSALRS